MTDAFHDRYRPKSFAEIVGQKGAVDALKSVLKAGSSHAFLFSSTTPGIGKTTLARICAREAGCLPGDIYEVPAAVATGVDDMRRVQDYITFRSLGGNGERAVILDECARLSKQGWDSLLKIIEEPPEHAYFFFCTTDVAKVPGTVRSRCTHLNLGPLTDQQIAEVLHRVIKHEGLVVGEDVLDLVVQSAQGSARQALVNLASCEGAFTRQDAAQRLQIVLDSQPIGELCRFLLKGGSWARAMALVDKLGDEPMEGVRHKVCGYLASTLKSTRDDKQVLFLLRALEAFETPFNPSEGPAPLLLAIGSVLYGKG